MKAPQSKGIKKWSQRISGWLGKTWHRVSAPDPVIIKCYRGYANVERFYVKGRVLENEELSLHQKGRLSAAVNSFKRFESDEIPHAHVQLQLQGQFYKLITDEEGYFELEATWQQSEQNDYQIWINGEAVLTHLPDRSLHEAYAEPVQLLYPNPHARYGIISDVDDTVLLSYMNSRFKLRMLYTTMFKHSLQRKPMEGVVSLYQHLSNEGENPVFYVSHSPWNLYDLISEFLDTQGLPKGPLFLRDFGLPFGSRHQAFRQHKPRTIKHILEMYPHLSFILLGDTASNDTDHYIEIAHAYPGRIKAIFIRQTKSNRNARRIKLLIDQAAPKLSIYLVKSSLEIQHKAKELDLI